MYKDFSAVGDLHLNRWLFRLFKATCSPSKLCLLMSHLWPKHTSHQQQMPHFSPIDCWESGPWLVSLCSCHMLWSHEGLLKAPAVPRTNCEAPACRSPVRCCKLWWSKGGCWGWGFHLPWLGMDLWASRPLGQRAEWMSHRGVHGTVNLGQTCLFLWLLNVTILVFSWARPTPLSI